MFKTLRKTASAQIAIGFVCLAAAFMLTLQIKSTVLNKAASTDETAGRQDLLVQLRQEREKNDNLVDQIMEYKEELQAFQDEAVQSSDYSQALAGQLEKAEILAGLTDLTGSGVIVTMSDSRNNAQGNIDTSMSVIHDEDLLRVINELADADAEAISVNDERILSTSEVRCAGSTVSINNNRYSEPYVIKAIGDPVNLENAIMMRDGIYDTLTYYGIEMSVEKVNSLQINAYKGTKTYKFAKPVKKEEE